MGSRGVLSSLRFHTGKRIRQTNKTLGCVFARVNYYKTRASERHTRSTEYAHFDIGGVYPVAKNNRKGFELSELD